MKTTTEIKFDRIIKESFHDILKSLGFKKKANNFYLQLNDLGQIINVQKSLYGSKDNINFTVNTGLFIPEYWLTYYKFHNGAIPKFPNEPDCVIRRRIGEIKYNKDKWFDINPDVQVDNLITEMKEDLNNYILPYFNMTKSKDSIVMLLNDKSIKTENLGRLIIYGEYKRLDKAQIEYNELRRNKYINRTFGDRLTEFKEKYGLQDQNHS